ncbi:hypothetical protein HQ571_00580 [Candidatus Kuenenbacteria bacterium]|nr:hypothetical protein [Candidatus Kuenenbacteria bacterium]
MAQTEFIVRVDIDPSAVQSIERFLECVKITLKGGITIADHRPHAAGMGHMIVSPFLMGLGVLPEDENHYLRQPGINAGLAKVDYNGDVIRLWPTRQDGTTDLFFVARHYHEPLKNLADNSKWSLQTQSSFKIGERVVTGVTLSAVVGPRSGIGFSIGRVRQNIGPLLPVYPAHKV